jgi:hypothetical protein
VFNRTLGIFLFLIALTSASCRDSLELEEKVVQYQNGSITKGQILKRLDNYVSLYHGETTKAVFSKPQKDPSNPTQKTKKQNKKGKHHQNSPAQTKTDKVPPKKAQKDSKATEPHSGKPHSGKPQKAQKTADRSALKKKYKDFYEKHEKALYYRIAVDLFLEAVYPKEKWDQYPQGDKLKKLMQKYKVKIAIN